MHAVPDDASDARHLLLLMQDQGVRVTATLGDGFACVQAVDVNGEVVQVRRDDVDLLAAVVEIAGMLGWEF